MSELFLLLAETLEKLNAIDDHRARAIKELGDEVTGLRDEVLEHAARLEKAEALWAAWLEGRRG